MIDGAIKDLLEKRKEIKKSKPVFRRTDIKRKKIGSSWRKPTGRHNKIRRRKRGAMPHPSYSSPKKVKGLHASGYKDILIRNLAELGKINKETEVARISGTVGTRKRILIIDEAKKLKVRILNPGLKVIKKIKELKDKEKKKEEDKSKKEKPKEAEVVKKGAEETKKEPAKATDVKEKPGKIDKSKDKNAKKEKEIKKDKEDKKTKEKTQSKGTKTPEKDKDKKKTSQKK